MYALEEEYARQGRGVIAAVIARIDRVIKAGEGEDKR